MKLAVVGSYGVGLTMRVEAMPRAGQTLTGGEFSSGHGGKGSNQAVAAQRLGAQVSFLTAVGDDLHGREALEFWQSEGIDISAVRVVADTTMTGVILVEENGENRIIIAPGALNHLHPTDVSGFRSHIVDSNMVVASLEIPLETAVEALRVGHEAGKPTLLNPAPAMEIPDSAWEWIDYVTPNEGELRTLLGKESSSEPVIELTQALHDQTGVTVVTTVGSQGALVADETGLTEVPAAPPKRVVDTTGAGDSFTGALAVGLLEGRNVVSAANFAAKAAAITVATPEVIPALPYRADLDG